MRKLLFNTVLALLFVSFAGTACTVKTRAAEPVYTNENGYTVVIEDEADLLTAEEETQLIPYMKDCTAFGHAYFKTVNENPYGDTYSLAGQEYYDHFDNESGVMFLIDMDERQVYIVSDGDCYRMLPKSKTDTITDNIYLYASRGDYYGCAEEAFSEIAAVLRGERIAEPMRYISSGILALLISMFVSFIVCYRSSGIRKAKNSDLLSPAEIAFSAAPARFTHINTSVRYDPPSESSGGGKGGGGGHGGGFSGGGGGGGFSGGGSGHGF